MTRKPFFRYCISCGIKFNPPTREINRCEKCRDRRLALEHLRRIGVSLNVLIENHKLLKTKDIKNLLRIKTLINKQLKILKEETKMIV